VYVPSPRSKQESRERYTETAENTVTKKTGKQIIYNNQFHLYIAVSYDSVKAGENMKILV
jgi:hypothetical protein